MYKIIYGTTAEVEYSGLCFHMHQPDYDILHSHNCYEFTLVIEGSYINVVNDKTELLTKGSAILLGLNDCHRIKLNEEKSLHLNILINKEKFDTICNNISENLIEKFNNLFPMKIDLNADSIYKILSYLNTIKIINKDNQAMLSSIIIHKIIEEFLINCLLVNSSTYPQNFRAILDECNSIKNLNWKSTDVAAFAHYSQTHLNRLFKKYLSISVVEYLTRIKMNAAINLLTTTNYSVADISSLLGYSSMSYFNKIFTSNFGSTPYKYKLNYFKQRRL